MIKMQCGRPRQWPALLVVIAFLLEVGCVGSLRSKGESSSVRDRPLLLAFSGSLFDQDEKRNAVALRFELPCVEKIGPDGRWTLETGMGQGTAEVLQPDGTTKQVHLKVRVSRYHKAGLPSGSLKEERRWSFRWDLHLESDDYPEIEMEIGAEIAIPKTGTTRTLPSVSTAPVSGDERARIVSLMGTLQGEGNGGGLLYGRNTSLWGRPPSKLPYMGYVRLTKIAE